MILGGGVKINVSCYMIKRDFFDLDPLLKNGFRAPVRNPLVFLYRHYLSGRDLRYRFHAPNDSRILWAGQNCYTFVLFTPAVLQEVAVSYKQLTTSRRLPQRLPEQGLRPATSVAVPRTTSSLCNRSFAVAAPRAWNKLQSPLRRVYSVNTVRHQLKAVLFAQAF